MIKKEFVNELNNDFKSDNIYLDIETTGFSRKYNYIYLIGLGFTEHDKFKTIQLFISNKEEEKNMLEKTISQIKNRTLITFNGSSFDLPFIKERAINNGLDDFTYNEFDIYKYLNKRKNLIKEKILNLKNLEKTLGIERNFTCDGKLSVELYKSYLSGDITAMKKLMKYNNEDVYNLYQLHVNYINLFERICVNGTHYSFTDLYMGKSSIIARLYSHKPVVNGRYYGSYYTLSCENQTIELKFFCQNGSYSKDKSCIFVDKKLHDLKYLNNCQNNILSPNELIILYIDKTPILENIKSLIVYTLDKIM